jgi:uncharacterized NAD(P)/FAD-binding protein YdhS
MLVSMAAADSRPYPAGPAPVIAVIGGGASGTLTAVQVLRRAAVAGLPARVLLIDRDGRHGRGRAYATADPAHLLNSPAGRMSGIAGDPGHLERWARAAGVTHDGFLSRRDYGRYLSGLLADARRRAWPAADLREVTAEVVSLGRAGAGLALGLAGPGGHREVLRADLAVLATGSLPPGAPFPLPAGAVPTGSSGEPGAGAAGAGEPGPGYVADPWAPGALAAVTDGRPVIIVGTGLTMLDVAMTVTAADPRTVVHAVSRHALLPREHRGAPPPGPPPRLPLPALAAGSPRLADVVRQVRAAAAGYPGDWQDVIDVLRPQVPALWQRLPAADREVFLRRYARYWEVHRHRVPPATARRVAALRAAGRLTVHQGRITATEITGTDVTGTGTTGPGPAGPGLRATLADGTMLDAGWLVNGTGPAADVRQAADPLIRDLLQAGLARPDALGLGLDADTGGAVRDAAGRPSGRLFALGPPLRGTRYETTAIAEIAVQAEALARHLIAVSHAIARPGSAA